MICISFVLVVYGVVIYLPWKHVNEEKRLFRGYNQIRQGLLFKFIFPKTLVINSNELYARNCWLFLLILIHIDITIDCLFKYE